jgi:hypothetical protein
MGSNQVSLMDVIEWMPDDYSPGCLICQNIWTMKRRRRTHPFPEFMISDLCQTIAEDAAD